MLFRSFQKGLRHGVPQEVSMGLVDMPFDIPNIRMENGEATAHTRIGWFRSVANLQHALPVGCFVDEIAHAAGRDPADLLRELLGPDRRFDPSIEGGAYVNYREPLERYPIEIARHRRVLDTVVRESRWHEPREPGEGRGIAIHRSFGSYSAVVMKVRVDAAGALSIASVDIAIDCGVVVNPDRVRAQLEGSVIMGITQALHGEITFEAGRVQQSNFHDYPVLRINEAPKLIRTHLVEIGRAHV